MNRRFIGQRAQQLRVKELEEPLELLLSYFVPLGLLPSALPRAKVGYSPNVWLCSGNGEIMENYSGQPIEAGKGWREQKLEDSTEIWNYLAVLSDESLVKFFSY